MELDVDDSNAMVCAGEVAASPASVGGPMEEDEQPDAPQPAVVACGNCTHGQLGIGKVSNQAAFMVIEDSADWTSLACGLRHAAAVRENGVLLTFGSNDEGELGRSGRPSQPQRVDAVETFRIVAAGAGQGFTVALDEDGRLITWGRNDVGQLGLGDREPHRRPRLVKEPPLLREHSVAHVACGAGHVLAVMDTGEVFAWGANEHGQLGDGTFVSSCTPRLVEGLACRPVVGVAAGASHSLAVTAFGSVYAWGNNAQGQLGLPDTRHRFRPDLVRSLRSTVVARVAAGELHSLVLSKAGVTYSAGASGSGQCGRGDAPFAPGFAAIPALQHQHVTHIACGARHSVALCASDARSRVFVFGLNASGQLGLGDTKDRAVPEEVVSLRGRAWRGVVCGGNSTFLLASPCAEPRRPLTLDPEPLSQLLHAAAPAAAPAAEAGAGAAAPSPTASSGGAGGSGSGGASPGGDGVPDVREAIAAAEDAAVLPSTPRLPIASLPHRQLLRLRKVLETAFCSVSVLNGSFIRPWHPGMPTVASAAHCRLDLPAVRRAYSEILALRAAPVLHTLGRATLRLTDSLERCPVDEPENMHVFLILLENPLLQQTSKFHLAIRRAVSAMLGLPPSRREMLFGWVSQMSSEYFARVVHLVQDLITFAADNPAAGVDLAPPILVLRDLYVANQRKSIVPLHLFYNPTLCRRADLAREYDVMAAGAGGVFTLCHFPFLLDPESKRQLVLLDAARQMTAEVARAEQARLLALFTGAALPHAALSGALALVVRRDHLLADTLEQLELYLTISPNQLKKPLVVQFVGEAGVDEGGLRKEFFQLAAKQLLDPSVGLFRELPDTRLLWFSGSPLSALLPTSSTSLEELAGTLLGLATYNGVMMELTLAPVVYRLLMDCPVTLRDLQLQEPRLGTGLRQLLEHEGCVEDDFGLTFQVMSLGDEAAAAAAAAASAAAAAAFAGAAGGAARQSKAAAEAAVLTPRMHELVPGGASVPVTNANRHEFVDRYVRYVLVESVAHQLQAFFRGFKRVVGGRALQLCRPEEVELLVCGKPELGDFRDLERVTEYGGGYSAEHPVVRWFWEVVHGLSEADKKRLLFFATGSDRVPLRGLAGMRFAIQRVAAPPSHLPVAHTCFNLIDLPEYPSKEHLRSKLLFAMAHAQGFGLA